MKKIIWVFLPFLILCGCASKDIKTDSTPKIKSAPAAQGRFIDKGDGTIADTRTGLIWLKNANIAGKLMSWQDAIEYCKSIDAAGSREWHLPTKEEFETLVKDLPANTDWRPLIGKLGFNNVQDFYWTSKEYAPDTSNVWSVPMRLGYVGVFGKTYNGFVWPVRSGK